MNSRSIEILRILSLETKTISDLARDFNVTERTIRNDLNAINDLLDKKDLERIDLDLYGNLILDLNAEQISSLLDRSDFYNLKLTKAEREKIIAYILVFSKKPITIQKLAETLFVSRSTINNDIEMIKRALNERGLSLKAFSNKGLLVEGDEKTKRSVLLTILSESDSPLMRDQIDYIESSFWDEQEFSYYDRQILEKIISEQLQLFNMSMNDNSFTKLRDYLEVMIKRNYASAFIRDTTLPESEEMTFSEEIYRLILLYFDIPKNRGELTALENLISSLAVRNSKKINKNLVEIQLFTRKFIRNVSKELRINLNDDYEFYESLSNHLISIQIDDGKFAESNPFVEQIVDENEAIRKIVLNNLSGLESLLGRELNEIDISYIVVHICAALERQESHNEIDIILVCNAGVGTSRLLKQRLQKHFNFRHIRIQTSQMPIESSSDALVISTVKLNEPKLDYIQVKPVLTDEDYIRIGKRIEEIHQMKKDNLKAEITDEDALNALIQEINQLILDTSVDDYKKLEYIDKKFLDYLGFHEADNPRLYEILTPEYIQLDVKANSWQEAIEISGKPLLKNAKVDSEYIKSCIEMIEEYGPYMFIGEGVLLPHSHVEAGSHGVGFSLVRLDKDIELENGNCIRYICMMSAVDEKKHLRALFTLGNLVQDKEYMSKLEEAADKEEVYEIIRDYDFLKLPINLY